MSCNISIGILINHIMARPLRIEYPGGVYRITSTEIAQMIYLSYLNILMTYLKGKKLTGVIMGRSKICFWINDYKCLLTCSQRK